MKIPEIVDLPIQNGWIFHGYVNLYQRVYPIKIILQSIIRVHAHKRQHKHLPGALHIFEAAKKNSPTTEFPGSNVLLSYSPCIVYLPTKLGHKNGVSMLVNISAPWFAYGIIHNKSGTR